jgi:hypothetical protein
VIYGAIASTIYFLKAIAIIVSRDLWGDRINNLFLKAIASAVIFDLWGDRYYYSSSFIC